MHTSTFFSLFPPPRFMVMKHAGLDISDDMAYCLEYEKKGRHLAVRTHIGVEVPPGLLESGDVKDEKKLIEFLSGLDKKADLTYVKASIPEEKAYLFQTDVPNTDIKGIRENIEFKLEENVPLSAADAVFYYDLLPLSVTKGAIRASVSVVPRTYIEKYISILKDAGMFPVSFEVVPKAIARAIVPPNTDETVIIVHFMKKKTGIYIVSGGVVVFTSTAPWGTDNDSPKSAEGQDANANPGAPKTSFREMVAKEITRVYAYWMSHGGELSPIRRILLTGRGASGYENSLMSAVSGASVSAHVADVWQNAFPLDKYIPPIAQTDSLEYVVAAGLALPS